MKPDNLKILNDSRMARMAWDEFGRFITEAKEAQITKLAARQRLGGVPMDVYSSIMGGYLALCDLENDIKRVIIKADKLEEEKFNGR